MPLTLRASFTVALYSSPQRGGGWEGGQHGPSVLHPLVCLGFPPPRLPPLGGGTPGSAKTTVYFSRISSSGGKGCTGIVLIACSATLGPTPMRARKSKIGAYITRSIVSS